MEMTISFDARVTIARDVLVSELARESVLLNLKSECYFGLDEMGTLMLKALTTSESIEAACEALLAEYDVSEQQLRSDLTDLLANLMQQGLVEVTAA